MASLTSNSTIQLSHSNILHLSQKAPKYLEKNQTSNGFYAYLTPLSSTSESPETWTIYEQLLISCLQTGDDQSAHMCLERLISRFGASNERAMGLRGLYQEAIAENDTALESVLTEYEQILSEDPTNTVMLLVGAFYHC